MKTEQQLLTEISVMTRRIEEDYPEIYKYLDENPMTIPDVKNPEIDTKVLSEYLESLKELVNKYEQDH